MRRSRGGTRRAPRARRGAGGGAAAAAGNRRVGIAQTAMGYYGADADSTADVVNYMYYDSPNTTSAITYACSFQHSTSGAVLHLNKTVGDGNSVGYERGMSIFMAQEIAQ